MRTPFLLEVPMAIVGYHVEQQFKDGSWHSIGADYVFRKEAESDRQNYEKSNPGKKFRIVELTD
jgi:hypothetical protein